MKRIGCLIAALSLLMTLSACHTGGEAEQTLRIGVALYQQEDTFIETVTRELQRVALEKEQAQNCKINLYITDGKESQTSQNEQVDRFLERGYDVICVNIVDRTAAAVIVDKAQAAGVPVIFFNREPVEEDLRRWKHAYYVGLPAGDAGVLQGELVLDAWRTQRDTLDRNGDGVIQYVMLEGIRMPCSGRSSASPLWQTQASLRKNWPAMLPTGSGVRPASVCANGCRSSERTSR